MWWIDKFLSARFRRFVQLSGFKNDHAFFISLRTRPIGNESNAALMVFKACDS